MEPNNIFETFFSFDNPAIMIAVIFAVLSVILYLVNKEFIIPLQRKKEKLENDNLRLMALFAELNPDPVLRVDSNGIIIKMNNPAIDFFSNNIINEKCDKLIPNYEMLKKDLSDSNKVISINKKHFAISIKESDHLEFTHVYLHDISKMVEQENLLKKYQENLRLLRVKLDSANETEREQIGRELHDHIGNKISVFKLSLQNHFENPKEDDLDELSRKIDFLSKEVRALSHQLSPKILKEFGLISALTQLVEEMTLNSTMHGHVVNINYDEVPNFNLKLGIYRICQEALNNIIKHAHSTEFQIQVIIDDNYLKVIISDDGVGCSLEKLEKRDKPSLGLLTMQERTESLNGNFEFHSVQNEGTTVYLEFDLRNIEI